MTIKMKTSLLILFGALLLVGGCEKGETVETTVNGKKVTTEPIEKATQDSKK